MRTGSALRRSRDPVSYTHLSGNRGRCAQPCRLSYEVMDEKKHPVKTGKKERDLYILSPKDLCTVSMIPELIENGVDSFKIEGRMKQPEYAAGVVSVYRKYIDLSLIHIF